MPLKDLIAPKAALAEEVIEKIIIDFVRYDLEEREIGFTPDFALLSCKSKVLVYLVALQGWPFVLEEVVPVGSKPAEIEDQLGISGGTLRPILKDLKDRHLLLAKDGRYMVRATSLEAIKCEIRGFKTTSTKPPNKKKKKASAHATSKREVRKTRPGGPAKEIAKNFNNWIKQGFFDEGKTLANVKDRFHEEAVMVPGSSIPPYLLKAVRKGLLERKKEDVGGKQLWVYRTKKNVG